MVRSSIEYGVLSFSSKLTDLLEFVGVYIRVIRFCDGIFINQISLSVASLYHP
ncbi:hypothetical protein Hanom_Chr14g01297431 [Helianthus anomalus]